MYGSIIKRSRKCTQLLTGNPMKGSLKLILLWCLYYSFYNQKKQKMYTTFDWNPMKGSLKLILLWCLYYSFHNQRKQKMYTTFDWKTHERFVKTDIIMVSLLFFS